jgi:hypothetical protein
MKNQMRARGVEADAAPSATAVRAGEEFDAFWRREIREISHSGPQVPAPRQLFYDIGRDEDRRPLSMGRVGQAIQALADSPLITDRVFHAFAEHVAAWIRSLRAGSADCLMARWEQETLAQADADVAQAKALRAVETHDVPALDAAIAETAEQLAELQRYFASLIAHRRRAVNERRTAAPRRHLTGSLA